MLLSLIQLLCTKTCNFYIFRPIDFFFLATYCQTVQIELLKTELGILWFTSLKSLEQDGQYLVSVLSLNLKAFCLLAEKLTSLAVLGDTEYL